MLVKLGQWRGSGHSMSAPSFSPTALSGCVLWLDAADTSSLTVSGSNVTAWADKSGNNHNVSQATSSLQPLSGSSLNGRNVVTFTNDVMTFGATAAERPELVQTIFIVYSDTNNTTAYGSPLGSLFDGSSTSALVGDSSGALVMDATVTAPNSRNGLHYDGGTFFGDGVSKAKPATPAIFCYNFPQQNPNTRIFTQIGSEIGGARHINGVMAEVIMYNRSLTIAEMNQVGTYLATK